MGEHGDSSFVPWKHAYIGCKKVISPCAAGSLQKHVKPGDIVFCDQFVDWTKGKREDTFFEGPIVTHVSAADPYCPYMRILRKFPYGRKIPVLRLKDNSSGKPLYNSALPRKTELIRKIGMNFCNNIDFISFHIFIK